MLIKKLVSHKSKRNNKGKEVERGSCITRKQKKEKLKKGSYTTTKYKKRSEEERKLHYNKEVKVNGKDK